MVLLDYKKKIIGYLFQNDVLVSPDILGSLSNEAKMLEVYSLVSKGVPVNQILSRLNDSKISLDQEAENTDIGPITSSGKEEIGDKSKPLATRQPDNMKFEFKVLKDYMTPSRKWEVEHFVSYFSARYKKMEAILKERKELANIISIGRLKAKKDRESISIIGLVRKKELTKNNNIILSVEDLTGEIKVLVNKTDQNLFSIGQDLVLDEVIGIIGMNGDNILFATAIIQPDIPLVHEFKKFHTKTYAVFLSDIHIGSKYFLPNDFEKFLSWIRCETGTDKQKEMASKVSFVFIIGDIVDGVGIYPNQEKELSIIDVYDQYKLAKEYLSRIPKNIKIFICPGNHDSVRLAEPQPKMDNRFTKPLTELPNVVLVSNPSYINICQDASFSGFDVLMYHGYSFDHYIANVDSIRLNGGYDRADMIMRFLLKRRHLAPTYTSNLFIPDPETDPLIIDRIPDFFITGHIHKSAVSSYRNITLISGSCFQSTTAFQIKVGHRPEPARVPVVDLSTRKITVLNFES